jgi:hypothetical protein
LTEYSKVDSQLTLIIKCLDKFQVLDGRSQFDSDSPIEKYTSAVIGHFGTNTHVNALIGTKQMNEILKTCLHNGFQTLISDESIRIGLTQAPILFNFVFHFMSKFGSSKLPLYIIQLLAWSTSTYDRLIEVGMALP